MRSSSQRPDSSSDFTHRESLLLNGGNSAQVRSQLPYRPVIRRQDLELAGGEGGTASSSQDPVELKPMLNRRRHLLSARNDSETSISRAHLSDNSAKLQAEHVVRLKFEAMQRWKQVQNWDQFFVRCYQYFEGKGFYGILLARIVKLLTLGFAIGFFTFLTQCIDHAKVSEQTELSKVVIHGCMYQLSPAYQFTLLLFGAFWCYEVLKLGIDVIWLREIYAFYTYLLDIPDCDIQTVSWNVIVQKIVDLHQESSNNHMMPKRMNAHDVVNRIMRKQNYMIALFNKDLLDLRLPWPKWIIGGQTPMLTKVLEWHINYCIMNYVFGETDQGREIGVRKEFLRDSNKPQLASGLRRRLIWMGLLNLLFAPFILAFLIVYFFFKYGEELHKNPSQLSSRTYTPMARWKFRDFNELPHLFRSRLNASYPKAIKYVNQFPQHKMVIVAKFIAFVSGSIALSLALFSLIDENILTNFQITHGRSVLWYLGVLGMIWTAARGFIPDPHLVFDPVILFRDLVTDTHYLPSEWQRMGLHTDAVRREFSQLFEYRIVVFFVELLAVLFAPFILWFSMPHCAGKIVDFFREFTVHVDGVGWICSFAVFDFKQFNEDRGIVTSTDSTSELRPPISAVDASASPLMPVTTKMEASALNFKRNFPEWQPQNVETAIRLQELMQQDEDTVRQLAMQKMHLGDANDWMQSSVLTTVSAPEIRPKDPRAHHSPLFPPASPPRDHRPTLIPDSLHGIDLARSVDPTAGSTLLEGGTVPYIPYHLYAERQPGAPLFAAPSSSTSVRNKTSGGKNGYVPPVIPMDDGDDDEGQYRAHGPKDNTSSRTVHPTPPLSTVPSASALPQLPFSQQQPKTPRSPIHEDVNEVEEEEPSGTV